MSNLPHADNVEMLRGDLKHFEESGDSGETVWKSKRISFVASQS